MNRVQREELSKYIRSAAFAEFTPPSWEIAALIEKIDSIMEFAPENYDQLRAYATAKEYDYVLRHLFNSDRKVMAIRFLRQATTITPGLRDAKTVVDHFWAKFTAEQAQENAVERDNV